MKKFGQLANKTLYEAGGDKKTNTIFERAKAVPGCAEMRGRLCGKPMAESHQFKHCAEPTRNFLRGDPHKHKSSHKIPIGQLRQEIMHPANCNTRYKIVIFDQPCGKKYPFLHLKRLVLWNLSNDFK